MSTTEAGPDERMVNAAADEWFSDRPSLQRTVGVECAFGVGFASAWDICNSEKEALRDVARGAAQLVLELQSRIAELEARMAKL